MLIVAALENDGVFMVREVELDESYASSSRGEA